MRAPVAPQDATPRGPRDDALALLPRGADDCVERSYPAGTAFVDAGHGHVHTAYNPTDAPTVLVATFFEAPEAPAPLLIPADEPDDCEV